MNEPCPVCANAKARLVAQYRGVHPAFAGMQRAECPDCGLCYATPMPGLAAMEEYNGSYFHSAHGGHAPGGYASAFFTGIARLRVAHIERRVQQDGHRIEKVLEIGPGPGFFARAWLERHPAVRYEAVETDASCHPALEKLGVTILQPGGTGPSDVDLVVISHVLEHVSDPIAFLARATQRLHPGGLLFVEVPCRDWEHKPRDEPHLLFFDKTPMKRLLAKVGFSGITVSYHGQTIDRLRAPSRISRWCGIFRQRLIERGIVRPFSSRESGMEILAPLERAVLRPFEAHRESEKPSWWLRAIAVKDPPALHENHR